jgi:non-ribosomal peptide synthetase component E (peptide arylation enzyme)
MQELPKTSVGKFDKKKLRVTVIPDILKKRGNV